MNSPFGKEMKGGNRIKSEDMLFKNRRLLIRRLVKGRLIFFF